MSDIYTKVKELAEIEFIPGLYLDENCTKKAICPLMQGKPCSESCAFLNIDFTDGQVFGWVCSIACLTFLTKEHTSSFSFYPLVMHRKYVDKSSKTHCI